MASVNFRDQLRRQLMFLDNSCSLFDRGFQEEAIRIATSLRVLFHDTKSSTSLVTHLKVGSCCLLSTISSAPGRRDIFPLVNISWVVGVDQKLRATPKLAGGEYRRFIPMNDWWNQEPVVSAGGIDRGRATRRDLVLWAANTDGGAHVDEKHAVSYQAVKDGVGMAIRITKDEEGSVEEGQPVTIHLQDLHFASLRQMAYEVLCSTDLLSLIDRPEVPPSGA